jgi:hypothetical protein
MVKGHALATFVTGFGFTVIETLEFKVAAVTETLTVPLDAAMAAVPA